MKLRKHIAATIACLLGVQLGCAHSAGVNNHPDSVFVATYANGPATEGIKLAYSVDCQTWLPIGINHSFVKSDFGAWGSNKRMFDPSVLYVDGKWYAVWTVNKDVNQFATTYSDDFWVWKPQDYPYASQGKTCLSPVLTKEQNQYVVRYLSSDDSAYKVTSADFKKWSAATNISNKEYQEAQSRSHTIKLQGTSIKAEIQRVPYKAIDGLRVKVSDAARRESLYNESTNGDAQRFRGIKSVKATLHIGEKSKKISENLIGIFFEDINYSADGGLYAELIQNRDFEYSHLDRNEWRPESFWELQGEGASFNISTDQPIHVNNSHYAVLTSGAKGCTLSNNGFDGIVLKKGEKYDLSLFAKSLGKKNVLKLILTDGTKVLASSTLKVTGKAWKQYHFVVTPTSDTDHGTLKIELQGSGKVGLDFISLFPQSTFKNRKNGLRADLAQTLADMKPRFVRFPGGCVSHGNGLENMYRWKETIGPLWERKGQSNLWGYHQSKGLGFYEYFQFCEDIGAEPLPVLPAGVCCQNSSRGGHGQQGGLPMEEMESYTQELLDLIEWANGDAKTSPLAKLRAEAGHPAPFNLKMIGVGNEDLISDVFVERFNYINHKIKSKYPSIQVVGTVGPFFEGSDYEYGWKLAKEENIDIVDEHYYVNPGWYIHSQDYYDRYDRKGTKVYLGEWASRGNRLENALAEALHVTNLERNGDVVVMSSYAPLLAKQGHTQWNPDLIYFDNTGVHPTPNYYVQKLSGNNSGNRYVYSDMIVKTTLESRDGKETEITSEPVNLRIKSSVVIDEKTGDMIVKLVNITPFDTPIEIEIPSNGYQKEAEVNVMSGKPSDRETTPIVTKIKITDKTVYTSPAYSFSVIRLKK